MNIKQAKQEITNTLRAYLTRDALGNYFNDTYQGIPHGGYNAFIEKLLEGAEVELNSDFFDRRE